MSLADPEARARATPGRAPPAADSGVADRAGSRPRRRAGAGVHPAGDPRRLPAHPRRRLRLRLEPAAGRPARGPRAALPRRGRLDRVPARAGGSLPGRARRLRSGGVTRLAQRAASRSASAATPRERTSPSSRCCASATGTASRGFRAACLIKGVYDLTLARIGPVDPGLDGLDAMVAAYAGEQRPRRPRPLAAQRRPARPAAGALRRRRRRPAARRHARARRALALRGQRGGARRRPGRRPRARAGRADPLVPRVPPRRVRRGSLSARVALAETSIPEGPRRELRSGVTGVDLELGGIAIRAGDLPLLRRSPDGLDQCVRLAIVGAGATRPRALHAVLGRRPAARHGRPPSSTRARRLCGSSPRPSTAPRPSGSRPSWRAARGEATSFELQPQRRWRVHLVHHSHFDLGYTDPQGARPAPPPRLPRRGARPGRGARRLPLDGREQPAA